MAFATLFPLRMEDNANLNHRLQYSTFGPRYNNTNNNNSVAAGLAGYPAGILKKAGSPPRAGGEEGEARNEVVIRRVVEMKQILKVDM